MSKAYSFVAGQAWAIHPSAVPGLLAIAERDPALAASFFAEVHASTKPAGEPEAVNPQADRGWRPLKETQVIDGVAVIPVRGVIARYANVMHDVCAATSVQRLSADVKEAAENPKVKAILYTFDTPGGQAAGIGELAGQIRAAAKMKPACAYVENSACSAGYWLAAATGCVCIAPSATVGSIGAVVQLDTSEDSDTATFVSSQSPMKRPDFKSKAGAAEMQAYVDALASVFVADVARDRKTTPAKVAADFGKGGLTVGALAVERGMADCVSDFSTVHARMAAGKPAFDAKAKPKAKAAVSPRPQPTAKGVSSMFGVDFVARLLSKTKDNPEAHAAILAEVGEEAITHDFRPGAYDRATATAPVKPEPKADPDLVTRASLQAEFDAKMEAERKTLAQDFYQAEASAWFDGLVKAGKAVPANKASAVARYVDAAMTDKFAGLISFGEGADAKTESRLDSLKGSFEAKADNGRLAGKIPGSDKGVSEALAKAGLTVLTDSGSTDSDREALEVVNAMLNATAIGQQAIADNAK